ncbi:Tim10/DDP family zinc finger-domain-containing protein [Obelidium mucronatum]|nr:Tim10/DDP family zinc finger-domain-containing protein [Obelidium mucronatum]
MGAEADKIKESIKNELAMQNYQDLLQRINAKCFAKCVSKPGTSLSGSEESCLAKCSTMYIEAWNVASGTYLKRVQRDAQ